MADVQVPVLQWPSFCYQSNLLFDDESLNRGKKRKAEEVEEESVREEEQKVPETRDICPPDSPELVFSNLMKRMAAKYQPKEETTLFLPHHLTSSHILAAMARVHTTPLYLPPPTKRHKQEQPRPLDLSPSSPEILDVVSVEPAHLPLDKPLEEWTISQVSHFIGQIENCAEYAEVG